MLNYNQSEAESSCRYKFMFTGRQNGETIYCTECKFGPFGMDTCPKRMTGKLTCMMATPLDDPKDYGFERRKDG